MKTIRYHMNVKTPLNPPMAHAVHLAQICTDGEYRQCLDIHPSNRRAFERWAFKNGAVINFVEGTNYGTDGR